MSASSEKSTDWPQPAATRPSASVSSTKDRLILCGAFRVAPPGPGHKTGESRHVFAWHAAHEQYDAMRDPKDPDGGGFPRLGHSPTRR